MWHLTPDSLVHKFSNGGPLAYLYKILYIVLMKRIIWLGSSYNDLLDFSKSVKQMAGYNLDKLQRGQEPKDWKPMSSIGAGVKELRIHCENEYRVIYLAQNSDGIYILHAFVKKSQKTSQKDIDLAKKRFKEISSNIGAKSNE